MEPPPRIPGYEILGPIGAGSMGVVYKARREGRKGLVALKVIAPRLAARGPYIARLRREARAACVVRHPNVVEGIDVGDADGLHYFAMEHVDGRPLSAVLKERGPIPEAEALAIARQAAEGLRAAWRAGVLHRDIKPSNLLVTREGQVKIADLGLAKEVDPSAVVENPGEDPGTGSEAEAASDALEARLKGASLDGTITRTGVVLGTPHYASPEQIRGERDLDIRTDIYGLGATLFQALTGRKPFGGTTVLEVVQRVLSEEVPSVRAIQPEVSEATDRLVRRMMAPKRQDRLRDPDALLQAIRRAERALVEGPGEEASEAAAEEESLLEAVPEEAAAAERRRRLPILIAIGSAAALVLLALGWPLFARRGGEAGEPPAHRGHAPKPPEPVTAFEPPGPGEAPQPAPEPSSPPEDPAPPPEEAAPPPEEASPEEPPPPEPKPEPAKPPPKKGAKAEPKKKGPRRFPPPVAIEAEEIGQMIPKTLPARAAGSDEVRPLEVGWRFRKAGGPGREGFSGRGYVVAAPRAVGIFHENYAGKVPEARYPVSLPAAGTCFVWIRISSDGEQNDTVHVGFNGHPGEAAIDPRKDGHWGWTNDRKDGGRLSFELPAGPQTLHLWMRESGVRIDKFALSPDPDWRPE